MLAITRHTDYAARLVLHLAALGDDAQVPIREIAKARFLPVPFVRRIVGKLVTAGIVTTVCGSSGGIRLGRPAAKISLLEIVEAMEGAIALNRCVHDATGCPLAAKCPVKCVWRTVNNSFRESLASVSFDVLARSSPDHIAAHCQKPFDNTKPVRTRTK